MHYNIIEEVPIYNSFLLQLVVSDDTEKINEIMGEEREGWFACAYRTNKVLYQGKTNRKGITVVLNPNYSDDDEITVGIIAHEAIHVKNMIFGKIGYKPKTNNDEAEAYFMEWIMTFIHGNYIKFVELERVKSLENTEFFTDEDNPTKS